MTTMVLEAGRKLDALVAQKVLKCKVSWWDDYYCACPWGVHNDDRDGYSGLLPYSTDIVAAWQVIGCLRKDGWFCQCTDLTLDTGAEWWSWHFTKSGPPIGHSVSAQGGSAPLAICLAALEAVGHSPKEG